MVSVHTPLQFAAVLTMAGFLLEGLRPQIGCLDPDLIDDVDANFR